MTIKGSLKRIGGPMGIVSISHGKPG